MTQSDFLIRGLERSHQGITGGTGRAALADRTGGVTTGRNGHRGCTLTSTTGDADPGYGQEGLGEALRGIVDE